MSSEDLGGQAREQPTSSRTDGRLVNSVGLVRAGELHQIRLKGWRWSCRATKKSPGRAAGRGCRLSTVLPPVDDCGRRSLERAIDPRASWG